MNRRSSQTASRMLARISRYLLIGAVVAAPLLLGGNRDWAVTTLFSMLSLSFAFLVAAKPQRINYTSPSLLVILVAVVATSIQLVPLSSSLLEMLSTKAHQIFSMSLGPDYQVGTLTLDKIHTQLELLKLLCLFLTAVLVQGHIRLNGKQRVLHALMSAISLAGTGLIFIGVFHRIGGWRSTLGMYSSSESLLPATFVNPNHFASFLGFAALASLTLFLTNQTKTRKNSWPWLLNAAVLSFGLFLTLSRAGIVLYTTTTVIVAIIMAAQSKQRMTAVYTAFFGVIFVCVTTLALPKVTVASITTELQTLTSPGAFSKIKILADVPSIVSDFSIMGIGRGALISVFPIYATQADATTVTHLENELLQAIVDWGPLLGSILLLGILISFVLVVRENHRKQHVYPIIAGIGFIALHNIFDFSLSTLGVAMPLVATLIALEPKPTKASSRSKALKNYLFPILLIPTGIFLAINSYGHHLFDDTHKLQNQLQEKDIAKDSMFQKLDAAIARHPADYFLHILKNRFARQLPDATQPMMSSLNSALYLGGNRPEPHLAAARTLLKLGRQSQAILEYRIALRNAPRLSNTIFREVIERTGSVDALIQLPGSDPKIIAEVGMELLKREEFEKVLTLVSDDVTESPGILKLKYHAQFALKQFVEAHETGKQHQRVAPMEYQGYVFSARALKQQGKSEAALELLDIGLTKLANHPKILLEKLQLLSQPMRRSELRKALKLVHDLSLNNSERGQLEFIKALLAEHDQNRPEAIRHLERSIQYEPSNISYLTKLVQLYAALGKRDKIQNVIEMKNLSLKTRNQLQPLLKQYGL